MKLRNIFLILFTLGVLAVVGHGQGRTNTLERNCASSTTKAKVEIQNGGKVNIQPCTTKDIDLTAPAANINLGVSGSPKYVLVRTITTAGTTGNQTINKPAGTVNVAAGASTITVTNNTVTTSSIVIAVQRAADATCNNIRSVVPASGSFVITLNATCTAENSIGFLVTN